MVFTLMFIDLSDALILNDLQMKNTKSDHILGEFLALHDRDHLQYLIFFTHFMPVGGIIQVRSTIGAGMSYML